MMLNRVFSNPAILVFAANCFTSADVAASENPPPVWIKQYEVERHVDAVRYVASATFRNNARGDFILEFTATRTDLPDTRERWTLTFENDEDYEHLSHLEVNGQWIYSSGRQDGQALLSAPGQSASVDISDPCADSNLPAYQALVTQVEPQSDVVGEVLSAIAEASGPPPHQAQSNPHTQCQAQCDSLAPPPSCMTLPQPNCQTELACCWQHANWMKCLYDCWCKHSPTVEDREACLEQAKAEERAWKEQCRKDHDKCTNACP